LQILILERYYRFQKTAEKTCIHLFRYTRFLNAFLGLTNGLRNLSACLHCGQKVKYWKVLQKSKWRFTLQLGVGEGGAQ